MSVDVHCVSPPVEQGIAGTHAGAWGRVPDPAPGTDPTSLDPAGSLHAIMHPAHTGESEREWIMVETERHTARASTNQSGSQCLQGVRQAPHTNAHPTLHCRPSGDHRVRSVAAQGAQSNAGWWGLTINIPAAAAVAVPRRVQGAVPVAKAVPDLGHETWASHKGHNGGGSGHGGVRARWRDCPSQAKGVGESNTKRRTREQLGGA